jgi:hypothetical protein
MNNLNLRGHWFGYPVLLFLYPLTQLICQLPGNSDNAYAAFSMPDAKRIITISGNQRPNQKAVFGCLKVLINTESPV